MNTSTPDLTGRKHLVTNVLATWVAQGVYMAAGFILPPTIDHHLGKEILGVWDFAWSLVGYFGLVQLGVVGSINRFVARYRAQGDVAGVNRAVSSVTLLLTIMSAAIVLILGVVHWYIMPKYAVKLGPNLGQAQWVVMILGAEVVIQTYFANYTGVLTGCHQWKLNTMLQTGGYALSALVMVAALLLGGTLPVIAAIHCVGILLTSLAVMVCAYRAFPGLKVRFSLAEKTEAMNMLGFGTKAFVPQMGELLFNQTISVLIISCLGPASLAIYSRPRNLVASMRTLVMKMGGILCPSSGALEANGDLGAVRALAIKTTRYTAFMTLPMGTLLVVMGGPILALWMGAGYRNDFLVAILSIGTMLNLLQIPVFAVLTGINRHGPPGWAHFGCSVVTAGSAWLALVVLKCGLVGLAVAATLPMALLYMIYMPAYTARCLKISTFLYLRGALAGPLLTSALFGLCLLAARLTLGSHPIAALVVGCGVGGMVLTPFYWRWALPESLKEQIGRMAPWTLPRSRVAAGPPLSGS